MKRENAGVIWPEIFLTGKIPEEYKQMPEWERKACLCADGLSGWACTIMELRPENFGKGMVIIGEHLDGATTGEKLLAYSKTLNIPDETETE